MSPASREPEWGEVSTIRDSFTFSADAERLVPPSGNPLHLLATSDALVFLGRSFGLPMADIARVLRVSRETVYQALRRANAALTPLAGGPARPPRRCGCGKPRAAGRRRCEDCWRERRVNRLGTAGVARAKAAGEGTRA
jgi:hypothetical protein